jgi:hypothetical protein
VHGATLGALVWKCTAPAAREGRGKGGLTCKATAHPAPNVFLSPFVPPVRTFVPPVSFCSPGPGLFVFRFRLSSNQAEPQNGAK